MHTFYTMKACGELGHEIGLVTSSVPAAEAIAGLPLAYSGDLSAGAGAGVEPVAFTRLQERFRSYWGVDVSRVTAVRAAVRKFAPDAVVVVGLDALPFFAGIEGAVRIWYAADEWILHHLSLVRPAVPASYAHVKVAVVKGLYERAYAPIIDRSWVVSEPERRAMRWLAGVRHVDVLPNGVDADHYAPIAGTTAGDCTAVFWGRLDFEPNVQGLEWFCRHVWPAVLQAAPTARFTILGFKPQADVRALARLPGVQLIEDLPDLRAEAQRHAVAVLPFVSGGGIKNKLLEAAAMGMAIVCTPRALSGLNAPTPGAVLAAASPAEWVQALVGFWADDQRRRNAGHAARQWVLGSHTWRAGAEGVMDALAGMLRERRVS